MKLNLLYLKIHPEKCFVESTKIWLAQKNFSFKYESMKILFELIKKNIVDFFFFSIPTKKFCIVSKQKKERKKEKENGIAH